MRQVGDILESYRQQAASTRAEAAAARPATGAAGQEGKPGATCPICKGKGFLTYDVPPGHPDFSKVVPCRCTQARLAEERARALHTLSNLGPLSRMTFDTFLPDGVGLPPALRFNLHAAYDLSYNFALEPKGWLVLLGGYGCGKTHLAAAIANYRLALGHSALFVVVADLLDHLRATYAPGSNTTFDERLEAIRDAPLLILDDLGAHYGTPWAQEKLFQILNYRYNHRLPTVITSNQRLEDMDPRITSRLVDPDLSQVYEILAPDFRQPGVERGGTNLNTLAWHRDQTFDTFLPRPELPADQQESLIKAKTRAFNFARQPEGWLVLSGTFGCGKTHLAAAIANYQVAEGRLTPLFVVVSDLLDHLRATFSPTSTTTLDKLFEQVKTASLLILDDLTTESATPWAKEKLFQLLNYRHVARLPTVITTPDNIDKIEPRLRSRMLDHTRCTFVLIEAPAYLGSEAARAVRGRGSRRGSPRSAET